MIIRSQDKLRIETFYNAEVGHSCNAVYVNGLPFGVYSTEEKAIKVLEMIQDAYCKMKNCDCILSGSSIDLCKASQEGIDNFIETNRKLYVFEMPQDSEV